MSLAFSLYHLRLLFFSSGTQAMLKGLEQDSLMSRKIKGIGSNSSLPCGDHLAFVGEWHGRYDSDCM